LAGEQPLVGTGGQLPGPGLFGPGGGALLAGLQAGLDGPAGDGGNPVLGRLMVLVPGGAGDPGAEELDLFAAAGPAPLFGLRRPRGPGEPGIQLEERLDSVGAGAAGRDRGRPSSQSLRNLLSWTWWAGLLVAGWPARNAAGLAVVLADRAVAAGPTLAFQLPLPSPSHPRPGASQPEVDAGRGGARGQGATAGGDRAPAYQG